MDGEHTARPPYFIHFGRGTVLGRGLETETQLGHLNPKTHSV
jgi:hypothetical protein